MKSREVRKLLFDVQEGCVLIMKFTEGRTLDQFVKDRMLQSAVERQAEIIGEALRQAAALEASLADEIPEFRRIIAFRNRLAHGYADISPEIVWGIAADDVPKLLTEVRTVMGESP
ncbi:MAG: HepT-like ribonuclease domain-containing protein [Spirochaetia bacterium]|jgi:uncharacterized protein with HEPN domain